jgi:site-specific DNA-methyltransferase (adenine-specific)
MNNNYYKDKSSIILNCDFLTTRQIKNESIDLIITSPPYNLDINYKSHNDSIPYNDYLKFTEKWLKKALRITKTDGRMCLNVPLDKNKGGHQSVGADVTEIAKKVGWKYHSTIIWNEGNISKGSAWGSWMSASAPYVIAPVELIIILYKGNTWKKVSGSGISDIEKFEFMDWTKGIWTFKGESKKRIGHPAPYPVELPKRCMKLFSFVGDTILDPFMGSGSTLVAAKLNNRNAVGIDIESDYCEIAKNRIINCGD